MIIPPDLYAQLYEYGGTPGYTTRYALNRTAAAWLIELLPLKAIFTRPRSSPSRCRSHAVTIAYRRAHRAMARVLK